MTVKHIHKAAGVIIENRRLLVVRSHHMDIFISPGGKLETGETSRQALVRELDEEVGIDITNVATPELSTFTGPAAGKPGVTVTIDAFFIPEYTGTITAQAEIAELAWVDSKNSSSLTLASMIEHEILPLLQSQNLID